MLPELHNIKSYQFSRKQGYHHILYQLFALEIIRIKKPFLISDIINKIKKFLHFDICNSIQSSEVLIKRKYLTYYTENVIL